MSPTLLVFNIVDQTTIMSMQEFTKEELLTYCKDNLEKLVIVINGNVYDVTDFTQEVYVCLLFLNIRQSYCLSSGSV